MAGMMRNLVTRVTVSAIVGAIVAGGIVWVSKDSAVRGNIANLHQQYEDQTALIIGLDAKLDQLLEANTSQANVIEELQARVETLSASNAELSADISQQSTSVAALEYARLEQSETFNVSFEELKASVTALSVELANLNTPAEPVDAPDFDAILDRMIDAVQRLDEISNSPRTPASK